MEEEGGGASGSEEVVQLEDAVEQLVEHLVVPVLPRGQVDPEEALSPETQEAVARQVRKLVLDPLLLLAGCGAVAVGFPGGSIGVEERAWRLPLLPVRFVPGVDLGRAACNVLGAFGIRGFYRLIRYIVPLSVVLITHSFFFLIAELRLSLRRHHGAYCGLFVSCLGLSEFAFVFPVTRLRLPHYAAMDVVLWLRRSTRRFSCTTTTTGSSSRSSNSPAPIGSACPPPSPSATKICSCT
jgi:hypothetical protein